MNRPDYQIRLMQRHELDTVLAWAAEEGWNPGLHDAHCFYSADPEGFLIGLLDGQPIASISVVRYGADYSFLGLYIVRPEHRGHGYGLRIWNAGLAQLGARAIGLDGVVAQQYNYRRSGFELAHRNIRFQGVAGASQSRSTPQNVVNLSQLPFEAITQYDRAFFPVGRDMFLQAWLSQPGGHALGLQESGGLTGYGVIRPCRAGYKIGPLFANHWEGAGTLFEALTQKVAAGSAVFLDVPETNAAGLKLAKSLDMMPMFETARMYKGKPLLPDSSRTYGITTFELG